MLPDKFTLEVVTPERRVVHASATEAQIPAGDGYLGILPGHAPLLATMGEGELSYREGGTRHYAAVFGGYVEVLAERVIVLAEAAERAEDIDTARARDAKERAEKVLAAKPPEEEAAPARAAIARAEIRSKVAKHASPEARMSTHAVHSS
jgi:F-type H+-transporting ATPase subunit epsilon